MPKQQGWAWSDRPRQELPSRKELLTAYNAEAEGLQKIHVRAGKQLMRLKLEEQMLLRMLATAREGLPQDSPLLLEETEELLKALQGVQTLQAGQASQQRCEGNGELPADQPTGAGPSRVVEAARDGSPRAGPSRPLGFSQASRAFQTLLEETEQLVCDEGPLRAGGNAISPAQQADDDSSSDEEWQDAAVGDALGHSLGDLVFGSVLQDEGDPGEGGEDDLQDLEPERRNLKKRQQPDAAARKREPSDNAKVQKGKGSGKQYQERKGTGEDNKRKPIQKRRRQYSTDSESVSISEEDDLPGSMVEKSGTRLRARPKKPGAAAAEGQSDDDLDDLEVVSDTDSDLDAPWRPGKKTSKR